MVTVIRDVVDAGYDHFGSQDVSSSIMTGWTTNFLSVMTTTWNAQIASDAYFYHMKDSGNNTPHQDGISHVFGPNQFQLTTPGQTNVSMRHYWQQMQSMKGDFGNFLSPLAGHYDVNSPSRYDCLNAGLCDGIEPVHQGNGTYKNMNISMSYMRGFEYNINNSPTWPSSNIPAGASAEPGGREHLDNSLEISVGYYNTPVWGCMNPGSSNYNQLATIDDGSCIY
jgi:hypothetical protein